MLEVHLAADEIWNTTMRIKATEQISRTLVSHAVQLIDIGEEEEPCRAIDYCSAALVVHCVCVAVQFT